MPYVLIDTFEPLFVARRVGEAEPKHVGELLAWVDRQLERAQEKIAFVYDAGADPNGRPDAKARRLGADWFAERRDLLERACAGIDFAFPSPLQRGALTAVFWITSPPIPCGLHATLEIAVREGSRRLSHPRFGADDVIESLASRTR